MTALHPTDIERQRCIEILKDTISAADDKQRYYQSIALAQSEAISQLKAVLYQIEHPRVPHNPEDEPDERN